jgi:hypothetical protein
MTWTAKSPALAGSAGEHVERAERSGSPTEAAAPAGERYLLLADISGYTGFMIGVEQAHGVDVSAGIPAAYSVLGALLDAVVEGLQPDFAVVKLEGARAMKADRDTHDYRAGANLRKSPTLGWILSLARDTMRVWSAGPPGER